MVSLLLVPATQCLRGGSSLVRDIGVGPSSSSTSTLSVKDYRSCNVDVREVGCIEGLKSLPTLAS